MIKEGSKVSLLLLLILVFAGVGHLALGQPAIGFALGVLLSMAISPWLARQ